MWGVNHTLAVMEIVYGARDLCVSDINPRWNYGLICKMVEKWWCDVRDGNGDYDGNDNGNDAETGEEIIQFVTDIYLAEAVFPSRSYNTNDCHFTL